MAWVETRITRTTQPQDAVGIDRSSKFGARVLDGFVGNDRRTELGKSITQYGSLTTSAAPFGVGKKGAGNAGFSFPSDLSAHNGITIVFSYVQYSRASDQVLFEHSVSQNTNAGTFIFYTSAATSRLNFGTSASNVYDAGYVTAPALGSVVTCVVRMRRTSSVVAADDIGLWIDGVKPAFTSVATNNSQINFGNYDTYFLGRAGTTLRADATIGGYHVLQGFASDAECAELSSNHWQIFEPEVQRIWVDDYVSAGGGATVIPIGVQATGSVGTPSATGAATTTPAGVSASSAVGTPVAVGGASIPATVLPAGVQATGAVGTVSATGAAVAQPVGVTASGAVGTPVAIGESAGVTVVYPAGVQAVSAVGTPGVIAAARVIPIGVQAVGEVGEPLAYAGDTPPVVATSNYGFEMSAGKRYYIKRKGKILLFDSAEQADDYLATEQQATVVTSRGAKKRIAAKLVKVAPIETIELEPVTELLSRYMPDVSLPNLLKMRDIEQVIAMQQQALMMQDDEDIELLLMTL